MPEVKIPENMHPFERDLNGKHYGPYAPGTVVDVPAEVAALIRDNAKLAPVEDPPETLEQEITRLATQIAEEKVAEATAPAVVRLTYDDVDEIRRGDKDFGEIGALVEQGKQVVVDFDIPSFEGWVYRAPITLFGKYGDDDTVYYWFEVQIVDPNTSSLMALVANGASDSRNWSMYAYPMYDPESGE